MYVKKSTRLIGGILLVMGIGACSRSQHGPTADGAGMQADSAQAPVREHQGQTAPGQRASPGDEQDVRSTVEAFGERLKMVSLLAPDSVVTREMRVQYGPFVTPDLLDQWIADPADAPGREVSSPWPEEIQISSLERQPDGEYRVRAQVIYVTSAEQASGRAASKDDVVILVTESADGRWRVSQFDKTSAG